MNALKETAALLGAMAVLAAVLACTYGVNPEVDMEATVAALEARVAQTATGAALEEEVTRAAPQTAVAKATATSAAARATQSTEQELSAAAQRATATAAVPILAALRAYEIDSSNGQIGWMHPPVTLEVEGYQQTDFANDHISVIAADFVISADITWNTQYGTSGCGFMLRSDGDQNNPNQYLVVATRGGSGHVVLLTVVNGELANGYDIYARGADRSFAWENDTTNRLTVVGRENLFEIYTNGVLLGEIDVTEPPQRPSLPPEPIAPADTGDQAAMDRYRRELSEYQEMVAEIQSNFAASLSTYREGVPLLERGFVAMVALSESGRTRCQFDNAWLWLIEE